MLVAALFQNPSFLEVIPCVVKYKKKRHFGTVGPRKMYTKLVALGWYFYIYFGRRSVGIALLRAPALVVKVSSLLTHSHTMTPFDAPGKQAFWKHCEKRRNCSLRAISPFLIVFSTRLDNFLPFSSNLKLSSANSFSFEESKICRLVMGQVQGVRVKHTILYPFDVYSARVVTFYQRRKLWTWSY